MTDPDTGRREKFREIFDRHKNRTYDFALRMLGDRDAAGDITQEVFLRLYRAIDGNPEIGNMQNWLFILTRNLCLNEIRDSKKEINIDSLDFVEAVEADFARNDVRQIRKAMSALNAKYKEVLVLREYEGFTYSEIAGILGITVPAVRSLLYKARLMLKENFEKISIKR